MFLSWYLMDQNSRFIRLHGYLHCTNSLVTIRILWICKGIFNFEWYFYYYQRVLPVCAVSLTPLFLVGSFLTCFLYRILTAALNPQKFTKLLLYIIIMRLSFQMARCITVPFLLLTSFLLGKFYGLGWGVG